jgi:hypothetical protein
MFGRREAVIVSTSGRGGGPVPFQDEDGLVDQSVAVAVGLVEGVEERLDTLGQQDLPLHRTSPDSDKLRIFLTCGRVQVCIAGW